LNGYNIAGVVFDNTNNLAKKIPMVIIHLLSKQVLPIKLGDRNFGMWGYWRDFLF